MLSRTQEQATGVITSPGGRPRSSVRGPPSALRRQGPSRIGRSTAYNAVRSGSLPAFKIEGRWLVPTAPLRKMLGLDDE